MTTINIIKLQEKINNLSKDSNEDDNKLPVEVLQEIYDNYRSLENDLKDLGRESGARRKAFNKIALKVEKQCEDLNNDDEYKDLVQICIS